MNLFGKPFICIDTREPDPHPWGPYLSVETTRVTLPTGDLSLCGCEEWICIERKSLSDLIGCLTQSRERFTKELQRAFSDNDLRPFTKAKRVRHIPLDPAWKQLYLARPRNINPESFVFTGRNGKPRGRNWARLQWDAAREVAGIAHITLYQGTRHSLASQAGNRGVPLQLISKFLGHSTLEQTKRYTHLEVNPLRQVQRKADVRKISSKRKLSR